MQTGDIVISRAGHDTDKYFVVTSTVSEEFVLIADGKLRTVERPKLKRIKHLRTVGQSDIARPTNANISKCIKKFNSDRRLYAEK